MRNTLCILTLSLVLIACAGERKPETVWDMYDVRKLNKGAPTQPAYSSEPYYLDNDFYYQAPSPAFGLCSEGDLAGFSCN